eukprot:m.61871 g.61871  ORF g.61871 m.61871 type:complete len:80 (-) comp17622_c0_seq1:1367-1606(-)
MSTLVGKGALAVAVTVASGTIWFVHKQMSDDRLSLRQGVFRDIARQKEKRDTAAAGGGAPQPGSGTAPPPPVAAGAASA